MRTCRSGLFPLLAAVSLSTLACSAALADGSKASTPDFRWQKSMSAKGQLEIHDRNGAIRLEAASSDEIAVVATKTGRAKDVERVRVVVKEEGDVVVVCALWPGDGECKAGGPGGTTNDEKLDATVDFVVRVPKQIANLRANTMNGAVVAPALSCPARLRTLNGAIEAKSTAALDAETLNGSVTARVTGKGNTVHLAAKNGRVELELPKDVDADVSASTLRGKITSEHGPVAPPRFPGVPTNVKQKLGNGGAVVELTTLNGNVALRRIP